MLPLSWSPQSSHTGLLIIPETYQVYSYLRAFAHSVTSPFPMAASSLLMSELKPHFFKKALPDYTV